MKVSFFGATQTVTGSRFLVESDGFRALVDCGLFQGPRLWKERNWSDFPVNPAGIDCVLLTHAHIDHSGYLPRLKKLGFRGPIYCTPATADLRN
jgi:metallo-beta-lactamase family protein